MGVMGGCGMMISGLYDGGASSASAYGWFETSPYRGFVGLCAGWVMVWMALVGVAAPAGRSGGRDFEPREGAA